MRRRPSCRVHALAIALFASPGVAAAQTKEECITAFEQGQTLRNDMKLRSARGAFRVCAADACSPPVRKDCIELLEDVSREIPTLVLGARDPDGRDLPSVSVQIDGERVEGRAGFPIEVDPGPRTLRFEHAPWAPVEERVVVRAGERNRLVVVALTTTTAGREPARSRPASSTSPSTSSTSPWAYVAAGAGAAALGSFAFFGIGGMSERAHLRDTCAPECSADAVSSIRTRFLIADVSLGVAVASLAAAAVLLLSPSAGSAKAAWPKLHFFARSF